MLNKKIETALNKQINAEMWSAYLYLSMSTNFASKSLNGMSKWFLSQYYEESGHALKIMNYIVERGGKVSLEPIGKVQTSWDAPFEAFEDSLKHEQKVTVMINGLVDLAIAEKDYASQSFLTWFVNEQVEEESTIESIVNGLKMVKDNPVGLYMLDKELGARGK